MDQNFKKKGPFQRHFPELFQINCLDGRGIFRSTVWMAEVFSETCSDVSKKGQSTSHIKVIKISKMNN